MSASLAARLWLLLLSILLLQIPISEMINNVLRVSRDPQTFHGGGEILTENVKRQMIVQRREQIRALTERFSLPKEKILAQTLLSR